MNASCNPLFEMRLSQTDLKAMFERNKQLAQLNQGYLSDAYYSKAQVAQLTSSAPAPAKRSKYGNVKVEYNGMKFDSKKELRCWQELELRQKAGEIIDLDRQVPFLLVVSGKTIGKFTADFTWRERCGKDYSWIKVVADAKSPATRKETAYRLRKRIFEAQYHPLVIREL